jgi:FkbM family methyltransferase
MKIAFDIGCNIGSKLGILLSRYEKVVGFEPNPALFQNLNDAYKNNERVKIDARALSNEETEKEFSVCTTVHTISTFSQDWIDNSRFSKEHLWNKKVVVKTTTLDSIITEFGKPEYVKIDVEGYEYEVLIGLNQMVSECVFSFEWAEENKLSIIKSLDHIRNLGYDRFCAYFDDEIRFDEQLDWKQFQDFHLVETLNPHNKVTSGMIYFKRS